jgi:mono/diheme cytochrome c family protein
MFRKIVVYAVGVICLVAGGGLGYLVLRKPAAAAPSSIRVEMTPARLDRGKYIFEALADCAGCHSERDFNKFGAPVVAGGLGKGMIFPPELGFPGKVAAPNITPDVETGIGGWSDGEKIRAIREGIGRDGRALFPLMPYRFFHQMSDEDVYSVVAYLNSLAPLKRAQPRTELDFPVNLLIRSAPQPVSGPVSAPDRAGQLKYGEYLATMAGCVECHTPMEKGQLDESKRFGGGREFRVGAFLAVSANISPDPETGIGAWSEERFVSKFVNYRNFVLGTPPQVSQANFTLMPWLGYSQLTEPDLKAIYAYLRTVAPRSNQVEPHPALVPGN